MRFSRLRLNGFKSFVDPTDLVIADGLTGVVGPNGCGKSNLLEALRWVMGENRPTAMRGGGMEDVIFAGAQSRPARNFAEVSLSIDNSDRLAPKTFNDSDALDIVRRITRDVGSAYKINGKDVRARDVQMLFADAATGAHSPALVRQGQIAELINAKPKNRRRILEDAAGIAGLYQRRHEAELKLNSTEANLARVDDVIEQLAGQLASLARQARQAARYRAIGQDLRRAEALLLYRRWRDADAQRSAAEAALRDALLVTTRAEAALREAETARRSAEETLPPLREEDAIAGALVQRIGLRGDALAEQHAQAEATIETLAKRLDQLTRDAEREAALNSDASHTLTRLREEAETLGAAHEGHDPAVSAAEAEAKAAAKVLRAREADQAQVAEDVARLAARHQSAHRLLEDSQRAVQKATAEAERLQTALVQAEGRTESAQTALVAAEAALAAAVQTAAQAEVDLTTSETARATAQAREADARAERSEAEGEHRGLQAELQALTRLLERDTAEGGQIMDRLQVEHGFETALGAALADDLRAPEVGNDGSGWAILPDYDTVQPLPDGVTPLTRHVSVPAVLERRMSQIGLVGAEEGSDLQAWLKPGQRLVSLEGDVWRWDGFRAHAADAPSAAALRLQQLNRLEALKQDMARAGARVDGARQAHEALTQDVARLAAADKAAREARKAADAAVTQAQRSLNRLEADKSLADSKLEGLRAALKRQQDDLTAARGQLAAAERGMADLGDLASARAHADEIRTAVEAARITMMSKRSFLDELKRDGETRQKRSAQIEKELASWQSRLESAGSRIAEITQRRDSTAAELETAKQVPASLEATRQTLQQEMTTAEARLTAAQEALVAAEARLRGAIEAEREATRAVSDAREARAGCEARSETARAAEAATRAAISEETGETPEAFLADLDARDVGSVDTLETEVNRLKRQRDALGAVNLRAEEDAREVQTEHDTLKLEKLDLEEAIKTLRSGIASLNREGRERLLTAFEQVNSNFSLLFTHLFGGGEANLVMVESDDPLEAGLEIMCQPPGKKLSTLSLLSGGEQTLTAMALIFAVFLANPAPICVLDEVDAPLDDANVTRFCDMLDEMCRRTDTRFLIITHHAVTMSRMDRLFGVTMQEKGVSQLVSVDLKVAEKMVA